MERPNTSEEIYKDLLSRIISLELEPGSMISENQICEDYHVSRSVIRNVFAKLSQANFLKVLPQRGTVINHIDLEYIQRALLLRLALEKEMLFRFMKNINRSDVIEKIEENIRLQERYYEEKDYNEEFKLLDEQFHNFLMSSSEFENVFALIEEHLLHISRWRNVYIKERVSVSDLIEEHKAILECIKRDDLRGAQEMMQKHIDNVTRPRRYKSDFFV